MQNNTNSQYSVRNCKGAVPSGITSEIITLNLLTWNVGVSQQGAAKRRDALIPLVLKNIDMQGHPHVTMIQESTIQQHKAINRWGLLENYQQQQERKGLRLGIDATFNVLGMPSLSDQIDSLVPKGATFEADALEQADRSAGFADIMVGDSIDRRLMRSSIPSRAFARKLEVTQNETKATIIVVSFHSIHNQPNRRRYIYLFFNLMCRLAQVHQCPVLIGGDFNLHVGDWGRDIERGFWGRVRVAEIYPPTPRRRPNNIIDTFAVAHPPVGGVTCTLNKPVAVYPFPDRVRGVFDPFEIVEFSYSEKEKIEELLPRTHQSCCQGTRWITCPGMPNWGTLWRDFDHDPVYVTVTLQYM